ncbi:MAG: hypothetical protein LBR61_06330 [Synergistaceae bacterium]|nr:hypothetical protein [Synergistaceae bacterium]
MMYSVNDTVLYGGLGLCRIMEVSEKNLRGKTLEYYVLKPLSDEKSTIFVPVNNETATANLRPVLSMEEIQDLIRTMPDETSIWIDDEAVRRGEYQKILETGDRKELIRLIKTLYLRRKSQKEKGKELHLTDRRFLREAEKMLHEEFAHVLNLRLEEVVPFILEQVQVEDKKEA